MSKKFQSLGLFLKESREIAKLTQRQVSDVLGYSNPQFISNMERGLCAPPLKVVGKLMVLYKISHRKMVNILVDEQRKFIEEELNARTSDVPDRRRKSNRSR